MPRLPFNYRQPLYIPVDDAGEVARTPYPSDGCDMNADIVLH